MCLFPRTIWNKYKKCYVPSTCNKCVECQRKYSTSWQFRLQQEYNNCKSIYFVTVTYDEDYLPYMSTGEICFDNAHITKFNKRLRSYFTRKHDVCFKYIITGELGEKNLRPHYHAVYLLDKFISRQEFDQVCRKYWNYAQVIDVDEPRSVNAVFSYVTKYIMKDNYRLNKDVRIEGTKTNKFRIHVSDNLGLCWIGTQESKEFYFDPDNHPLVALKGDGYSRVVPLPRYYRKKIGREYSVDELNKMARDQDEKITQNWIDAYNTYISHNGFMSITDWFINVWDKRDERRRQLLDNYRFFVKNY